MPAWKFSEGGR